METISSGIFRVVDGEVITIDVRKTGTIFLVNHATPGGGGPLTEGQPLRLTMDKSQATGNSNISNAKSTTVTLLFSFSSDSGGRYDWTVAGSEGGDTFPAHVKQAGEGPESVRYRFHIV